MNKNNNSKDSLFYFTSACSKYALGDYDDSIEDFTTVISLNPHNANAYYGRGECKKYLEDYIGSFEDYQKAIEIDKEYKLVFKILCQQIKLFLHTV